MIDKDKVYSYFDRYHGPVTSSTNGWYTCKCPYCGKNKFAINFTYLIGKCWKGCYGRSVFLVDVIRMYHGLGYLEARDFIDSMDSGLLRIPTGVRNINKNAKIDLPFGYHLILDGTTSLAVRAREYLQNRNFDLNYLDRIGVGYCNEEHNERDQNYFGRIIVPFKKNGILSYFIGRDFLDRGDKERYKNPSREKCGVGKSEVFFNEEALYMQDKVYLTEGWACAATIIAQGISQQGTTPSVIQKNIIIKSPVEEVIIVPDAGYYVSGLETARNIMRYKKTKVLYLDFFKQAGIGKDINEIGLENVINLEKETPYMTTSFLFHQFKIYANKRVVV